MVLAPIQELFEYRTERIREVAGVRKAMSLVFRIAITTPKSRLKTLGDMHNRTLLLAPALRTWSSASHVCQAALCR